MTYNPKIHHRRSIRLRGFNYSESGWYYVTICTHNKTCFFGDIIKNEMILNYHGSIVKDCWLAIPRHFDDVELGEHVIMPNHIHGIIRIVRAQNAEPHRDVRARHAVPLPADASQFGKSLPGALSTIIRSYKSAVTKRINEKCNTPGAKLWHRNYYEHVIRNRNDWVNICNYIRTNPAQWHEDENYVSK